MIKIDVDDYCHRCSEFSPEADIPTVYLTENRPVVLGDIIVQCIHRDRCRNIRKHIERAMQEEQKTE